MAIFSATSNDRPEGRTLRTVGQDKSLSILAAGMKAVGEMKTSGVLKIDGTVEGTVRADGQVLIAEGGLVIGDIFTAEAVVGGEVRGNIHADQRVELQAGSRIEGDVHSPSLVVQEGAELNGSLYIGTPAPEISPKKDLERNNAGRPSSGAGIAAEELMAVV